MIKIIYKLLFKSKSILVAISMILLPVLLTLIIGSMLFVNNVLYSYKLFLEKSYIGLQPKSYIKSNPILINKLYEYAKKNNITASKASHIFQIVEINNNYKKKVEFVVLDKDFMKYKFHTNIAINSILAQDIKGKIVIKNKSMKKPLKITPNHIIPTGFLTNSSIIFISKKEYLKYFNKTPKENILEIEDNLEKLESVKNKYSKIYHIMNVHVYKRIDKIKESKELFEKIDFIKNVIIVIILLFSIFIITLLYLIMIEIKKKEIIILKKIGISVSEFYKFLLLITFFVSSLSILLGYFLYLFFVNFIKIDINFSIISDIDFMVGILLFIPISMIIVFISLKFSLRNFK